MRRYAEGTKVSVESSRGEITGILAKHGVARMGWMASPEGDELMFELQGGQYRLTMQRPTTAEMWQRHPNAYDIKAKVEAEWRRRWRANVLLLKAKLEFIDSGDTTIERELLPYRVLKDGRTLEQVIEAGGFPLAEGGELMTAQLVPPTGITLSVGPRNAFTSDRGLRFYRWQGNDYPSVTTIRRMAGLPFNLSEWQIGKVAERAIEHYAELGQMLGPRPTDDEAKAAKVWLRKASTDERDSAATLGTRVHDAAAKGTPVSEAAPDVQPYLRQFYDWLRRSKATILTVERQVWNLKVGYAGTFDLLIQFPDGRIFVVDLKTGRGTYAEHALQACAYAMGEHVGEDDVIDPVATEWLKNAHGIAILHLSKVGWSWQQIEVTPRLWSAFRALLNFATWAHDNPKIDDLLVNAFSGSAPKP